MKISLGRIVKKLIDAIQNSLRSVYYRYIYLSWVSFGRHVVFLGRIQCLGVGGEITIGNHVVLGHSVSLSVAKGGQIYIGDECSINHGCVLSSLVEIRIGNRVRCGENVSIRDNDHQITGREPIIDSGFLAEKVKIEDDVWLGRNVTIMPGCHIGNGAIVGANAFVNRDVPPFSIVVGIPARVIKYR